jgi:hypothetical protein
LERNCARCIGKGFSNDGPLRKILNLKCRALDIRYYVFRHFACTKNIIMTNTSDTWWVDRSDTRCSGGPRATASLWPVSWISTDANLTNFFWFSLVSDETQNLDKARVSTQWPAEHCALFQSSNKAVFVLCWGFGADRTNCRHCLYKGRRLIHVANAVSVCPCVHPPLKTLKSGYSKFMCSQTVISGSLSPRHGAYVGCGWRNGLRYGG